MYPRLIVNLVHIRNNVRTLSALCAAHGISITAVSKVFAGDPVIAQCYVDAGIKAIGDSRMENIKKMQNILAEKWLIRPPMLCESEEVVRFADVSLNTEIETIRAIAKQAHTQNKRHKIILMVDLGDIREGYINYQELFAVAKEINTLKNLMLYGVGTNLTCFSFVQPNLDKMRALASLYHQLSDIAGYPLPVISGGNSATINLMQRGGIAAEINNLRLGESLLFGRERSEYQFLPNTFRDAFILECQIIELKEKPSLSWGTIGVDSYGKEPVFVDRGSCRLKAICALGKQDFDVETARPLDSGIIVLGASSDHLMLDVTDSMTAYHIGDIVRLELGYFSTMRAFTSNYIEKVYQ